MLDPPLGICVLASYVRCRDGDTVVVELRTGQEVVVRLIGIDAPEMGTEDGRKAKEELEKILSHAQTLKLWVDLPKTGHDSRVDIQDILALFSFDRVPGRLFADDQDVSETMIRKNMGRRIS